MTRAPGGPSRPAFLLLALLSIPALGHAQDGVRIGAFTVVTSKDEMDDSEQTYLVTTSTESAGVRVEAGSGALSWKCEYDGLNILVFIGTYMGGDDDDEVVVRTRLDSDPPSESEYWSLTANKYGAWMPVGQVRAFTVRALRARSLLVRVTDPLDGETVTHTFELAGLQRALAQVRPCKW